MSTIRCDIVSAEQEIFRGEATLVVATGELGELGIAPKHAPLITRLKPGKVVVTTASGEQLDFAISGGILEVQPQVVTVLVDTAIRAQDIDEAAVRKAKEEAERLLANRGDTVDVEQAQRQLAKPRCSCRHWSGCVARSSIELRDSAPRENAGLVPAFSFLAMCLRWSASLDTTRRHTAGPGRTATGDAAIARCPSPSTRQPP